MKSLAVGTLLLTGVALGMALSTLDHGPVRVRVGPFEFELAGLCPFSGEEDPSESARGSSAVLHPATALETSRGARLPALLRGEPIAALAPVSEARWRGALPAGSGDPSRASGRAQEDPSGDPLESAPFELRYLMLPCGEETMRAYLRSLLLPPGARTDRHQILWVEELIEGEMELERLRDRRRPEAVS